MTYEHMRYLLNRFNGVGVITSNSKGDEICYFYEDFESDTDGIKRAMKQLYPLVEKGKLYKVTFVENSNKKAI